MKRNLIKRVSAWALGAALTLSSYAFTGVTIVNAGNLNLVQKQTANDGYSTTYSYNKNGLISKSVKKASYTTNDTYDSLNNTYNNPFDARDIAANVNVTITTTYKYNKKNYISQKTETTETAKTYIQMDPSTGLTELANLGTITTTETTDTVFTYNKKGLATQSVATTTRGMTGSATYTGKTSAIMDLYDNYSYDDISELSDGRVIAGYNIYDENGKSIPYEERYTMANAYFLSNPYDFDPVTETTTLTYTDKGGGVYTCEEKTVTTNKDYYPDEEKKPAGNKEIITGVTLKAVPAGDSTSTNVETTDTTAKTVTTTAYSYDKNNRVKKAVATSVASTSNAYTEVGFNPNYYDYDYDSDYGDWYEERGTRSYTKKRDTSEETTTVTTTTFTYDKKGRATKAVVSNDGAENSKTIANAVYYAVNSYDIVRTYDDLNTINLKTEEVLSNAPITTATVTVNGEAAFTATYNPYTITYTENGNTTTTQKYYDPNAKGWMDGTGAAYTSEPVKRTVTATPSNATTKYAYDKKGFLKSAKLSGTETEEYNVKNDVYGNTIYEENAKGEIAIKKALKTNTYTNANVYENTIKGNDLTEVYEKISATVNRATSTAFTVNNRKFTLKKKSAKADKIAKLQQWIIKNGRLNGQVGLI